MVPETVMYHTRLMLTRRGYDNIEYREHSESGLKPRLIATALRGEPEGPNTNTAAAGITVFFIKESKVTINVVKALISISKTLNIMIIYKHSLTPDAKQSIFTGSSIYTFEIFSFDEMSYDPIEAVPLHRKVEWNSKEWSKLPYILTSDFISRYFGFKHGDTIAIEENNAISYRKCVKID